MLEACKRIAKRVGLNKEEFFLHKLRSTFATWHADAGVPVQVIQKWMGHKNIETTIRYIRPNRSVAITEKFNAPFKGI
jgi:integrase